MTKPIVYTLLLFMSGMVFGQTTELDSLMAQRKRFQFEGKYDSLLLVCKEIKSLDYKLPEEEDMDYDIIHSYFQLGQFSTAVELGEKYLKNPAIPHSFQWEFYQVSKHYVCLDFYEYYWGKGDFKLALKYILLAEKKYVFASCGVGLDYFLKARYQKIVDCYEALNDPKGANKYRKMILELNDQ